nr:MAG TPA: hypothetical protein [Caudoviricetes sp.]
MTLLFLLTIRIGQIQWRYNSYLAMYINEM